MLSSRDLPSMEDDENSKYYCVYCGEDTFKEYGNLDAREKSQIGPSRKFKYFIHLL